MFALRSSGGAADDAAATEAAGIADMEDAAAAEPACSADISGAGFRRNAGTCPPSPYLPSEFIILPTPVARNFFNGIFYSRSDGLKQNMSPLRP